MAEVTAYAFPDAQTPIVSDHPEAIYWKAALDPAVQAVAQNDNMRVLLLPAGYALRAAAVRTSGTLGASTQVKIVVSNEDDSSEADVTALTTAASAATAVQSASTPAWALEPSAVDRRIKVKLIGAALATAGNVYAMLDIALPKGFIVR